MQTAGTVTQWLRKLSEGDETALEALMPLLYDELHQAARQRMQSERAGHTLGATALVNEVYLKLIQQKQLRVNDRSHFMAIASRQMRHILVDYARARNRTKRGGGQEKLSLEEAELFLTNRESEEIILLDAALDRLKEANERAAQVVQYRFFCGLTLDETAELLGISKRSVQRTWVTAKSWLRMEISREISL